ncbi:hypothetical protein [Nonomuraea sediminis]|uniref:hypothetical protein n=1 Tax=Nonomuraea sediminis TaxID=2835864 RepID=UPI001BDCCD03|nr:hypothetical protein [Nonomuraea sediminis]
MAAAITVIFLMLLAGAAAGTGSLLWERGRPVTAVAAAGVSGVLVGLAFFTALTT